MLSPPLHGSATLHRPLPTSSSAVSLIPDVYIPSVDDNGNYCDGDIKYVFDNSLKCPCSGRIYIARCGFIQHAKTKVHQKWLDELNKNKQNYYAQTRDLETLTNEQKFIIQRLEKEIQKKNKYIIELTMKLLEEPLPPPPLNDTLS